MSIVVLKLPDVKQRTAVRPREYPYCEGQTFQRWGQVNKPVKDVRVRNVKIYRYRCCHCKRTFRHHPAGNTRADQTERLRLFAIVLWTLGLSHRASSLILSGLQVMVSFMTIWRDVQSEAQKLNKRKQWKPVRVLGLDGAYVLGWGEKQPVLVAVDLGTGEPIALGYVNEYDPQAIRRWLEPLVQQHGITVIVTDDLFSYKVVAEKLQLGHQVCQFHVRRWVAKTLTDLQESIPKEWLWSWKKFGSCWNACHPMAVNSCMRFGSSCRVVVPNETRSDWRWNNYEICSCA
jgi:transposase-like protein